MHEEQVILLTCDEAATLLKLSRKTVWQWAKRRLVAHCSTGGDRPRVLFTQAQMKKLRKFARTPRPVGRPASR